MRKSFSLFFCILCCLFPFSACAQPEKSIEDHVNLATEQLGKPLGEAFAAMKLPGSLENAAKLQYCLFVEDGAEVLGRRVNVTIFPMWSQEEGKELKEYKTANVAYSTLLENEDDGYPFRLYEALLEAYGEPEPVSGVRPFSEATEETLKAMLQGEGCLWTEDGYEIELSVSAGPVSGKITDVVSLKIELPIELLDLPPIDSSDGVRNHADDELAE